MLQPVISRAQIMTLMLAASVLPTGHAVRAQDCNSNGILDQCDISCVPPGCAVSGCGLSFDCNSNGIPDECEVPANTVLSVWDDAAGDWSVPTNWCPDVVPNNAGGVEYEVLIAGSNSIVNLDFPPVVRRLTLQDCARLEAAFIDFTAVLGPVLIDSGGRYVPRPGAAPPRTAVLTADTITLDSSNGIGGRVVLEDAMSVITNGDMTVNGLTDSPPCDNELCPNAARGGTSPPVLRLISLSRGSGAVGGRGVAPILNVGGSLTFENRVRVVIGDGTVNLDDDFANRSNSPDCFDWANGTLALNGGNFSNPQVFEMAGHDFGPSPSGFVQNFDFGRIVVSPSVVVDFVDNFDNDGNGQSVCEVLYVRNLNLGAGSTIRLHGCNVYYQCLFTDPGATVDTSGGGNLVQVGSCQPAPVSVPALSRTSAALLTLILLLSGIRLLRRAPIHRFIHEHSQGG